MPVEDMPDVPTLEEMYQLHKRHGLFGVTDEQSEEARRTAWFFGADAVNGKLLLLLRDRHNIAKVLEAWDSELLDRAVARTLARQARREEPETGA